jgi:maltooligosyltrehalose trehalohydrolase
MGLDALWNDDFHHSASVALTGRREAYYSDYSGSPQEFVSTARYGFLFQGQRYAWQKNPRGTPSRGLGPSAFVNFLENHDQVANSLDGRRLRFLASPALYRAFTALLLLAPGIPMIFQGQEFGASTPFRYFADHGAELARKVQEGRAGFVAQFPSLASPAEQGLLPVPHDPASFEQCRLDWRERDANTGFVRLHRDLLALRRELPLRGQGAVDGAVIGAQAFVLRYIGEREAEDRLLIVNCGADLVASSLAEPLVAPPAASTWRLRWSSENPEYGGTGAAAPVDDDGWRIAGHSAFVLEPVHGSSRAEQA